ncbi:hypothetical protein BJ170DRAFT_209473 [Xylariales sp. AK1849]|nr:hypothetical protein BJ170DRAFT_209473 [Xylariales sp. AK1849]
MCVRNFIFVRFNAQRLLAQGNEDCVIIPISAFYCFHLNQIRSAAPVARLYIYPFPGKEGFGVWATALLGVLAYTDIQLQFILARLGATRLYEEEGCEQHERRRNSGETRIRRDKGRMDVQRCGMGDQLLSARTPPVWLGERESATIKLQKHLERPQISLGMTLFSHGASRLPINNISGQHKSKSATSNINPPSQNMHGAELVI